MMSESETCAQCGSTNVSKEMFTHKFTYGDGVGVTVELSTEVPLLTCEDCGFEYFNYETEEIRENTVQKYLRDRCPRCFFVDWQITDEPNEDICRNCRYLRVT